MRGRHAVCVGAAALALLPLLGALGSSAGAQTDGGQGVADLPSETQPSGAPWLDAVLREILLAEGLLLLFVVLELGLFVAGMEAFDWWRERRAGETAQLRGLSPPAANVPDSQGGVGCVTSLR
jgi:hypothetical protein